MVFFHGYREPHDRAITINVHIKFKIKKNREHFGPNYILYFIFIYILLKTVGLA